LVPSAGFFFPLTPYFSPQHIWCLIRKRVPKSQQALISESKFSMVIFQNVQYYKN
jgi:hypothetical protein